VVAPLIAAAEWGGEFEGALDDVNALFDMPYFLFEGTFFALNRTVLIGLLMTLAAVLFFAWSLRNASATSPSKGQLVGESILGFVRDQIGRDMIGPASRNYVPLLATLFVLIFLLNFAKITPLLMLPPTSRMGYTAFFAIVAWVTYIGVGIRHHGLTYFKDVAFPPGVPWPLYILLTPIEIVSNLFLRPITLAIRLFANMVAGHILVVITLVATHVFLGGPFDLGYLVGLSTLALSPVVFLFEFFVIALQAYVFTLLTAVYIESSINPH
jgi:F-type H+-transporting ATPase subunit a